MRKFVGHGVLHLEEIGDIEGKFRLLFEDNGRTILVLDLTTFTKVLVTAINKLSQGAEQLIGSFSGTVDTPSGKIKANQVYLTKFRFGGQKGVSIELQLELRVYKSILIEFDPVDPKDEVEVRYGLTNLLFFGREITKTNGELRRDTIRFRVDNFDIELVQVSNYREIERHLREKKGVKVTSEMILKTSYKNIAAVDEVANNIRWLCCLATGNYVTDLYQDLYKEGKLARTILKPLKTYPFTSRRSAIDTTISGNGELETFLRILYPEFVKYKDELGLEIVIEYYITSKIAVPLEVGYILGAVTFECIESYLSQYFRTKNMSRDLSSFKSKTRALFDEFGVSYNEGDLDFIDVRDKVVHTGRFPKGVNPLDEYLSLINLLDRALLTILGYKGNPFFNVSDNKKEILE